MRRLVLVLALLTFGIAPASGQAPQDSSAYPSGQWSVSAMGAIPQDQLAENISTSVAKGVNVAVGGFFGDTPLFGGMNLQYARYGFSRRTAEFSRVAGPALPITQVETTNGFFGMQGVLRLQPAEGYVRPYLEALTGFKYMFTSTRVDSERWRSAERFGSKTNFSDWALSGGIGGGVDIRLGTYGKENDVIGLRIGGRLIRGSEARYLREGPLVDHNQNGRLGNSELRIERSLTNFVEITAGFTYTF